jgi:SHS2 domain-containing protein
MPFRFLPEIAIADVAFAASGASLEELFTECAMALEETQVNTAGVRPSVKKQIVLEHDRIDGLLFDFLSELVYLKDAEVLVFSSFDIKITKNKKYKLLATALGEKIDPARHELRNDVKAVTYYRYKVERTPAGWTATVVLDI